MADIVLIDDDPDIRTLTQLTLELDGNVVQASGSGLEGLALLTVAVEDGKRPVVVLDVQMPDVDGWNVLQRIRDEGRFEEVPVVMCTVRAGGLDRERGYGLGADAYEAKPFDLDQLLGTVRRLAELALPDLLAHRAELAGDIAGTGPDDED